MGVIASAFYDEPKAVSVAMIGLNGHGKTCILYWMTLQQHVQSSPTVGFNAETVIHDQKTLTIFDLGGSARNRGMWQQLHCIDAHIFVLDCSDLERLEEAKFNLGVCLSKQGHPLPLLVYANKQDCENALSEEDVKFALGLQDVRDRQWHVQSSCGITGKGIKEGLDWLCSALDSGPENSRPDTPFAVDDAWEDLKCVECALFPSLCGEEPATFPRDYKYKHLSAVEPVAGSFVTQDLREKHLGKGTCKVCLRNVRDFETLDISQSGHMSHRRCLSELGPEELPRQPSEEEPLSEEKLASEGGSFVPQSVREKLFGSKKGCCLMCSDTLKSESMIIARCGHTFHSKCLQEEDCCPRCMQRFDASVQEIIKLDVLRATSDLSLLGGMRA